MPRGTKVDRIYQHVRRRELAKGVSESEAEAKAARVAQAMTGKSLATGKKPKGKKR